MTHVDSILPSTQHKGSSAEKLVMSTSLKLAIAAILPAIALPGTKGTLKAAGLFQRAVSSFRYLQVKTGWSQVIFEHFGVSRKSEAPDQWRSFPPSCSNRKALFLGQAKAKDCSREKRGGIFANWVIRQGSQWQHYLLRVLSWKLDGPIPRFCSPQT